MRKFLLVVSILVIIGVGLFFFTSEKQSIQAIKVVEASRKPILIFWHYVPEIETEKAELWGIPIELMIEREKLSPVEEIRKRNRTIKAGDWIKIPIFTRTIGPVTASWYGEKFRGKPMANGELFDPDTVSVASKFLPKGTVIDITNLDNGRIVKNVEVTDSGPYAYDVVNGIKVPRSLDLSRALAERLGDTSQGLYRVEYTIVSIPPNKLISK